MKRKYLIVFNWLFYSIFQLIIYLSILVSLLGLMHLVGLAFGADLLGLIGLGKSKYSIVVLVLFSSLVFLPYFVPKSVRWGRLDEILKNLQR